MTMLLHRSSRLQLSSFWIVSWLFWISSTSNNSVVVLAFPNGAGGCQGGQAAVNGTHLQRTRLTTGSLEDNNLQIVLNGRVPLLANTIMNIPIGIDHTWTLQSTDNDLQFRGFLLRLEGPTEDYDTMQLTPRRGGEYLPFSRVLDLLSK